MNSHTEGTMTKKYKIVQVCATTLIGLEAQMITIETSVSQGVPCMHIVGLGDSTVKESRERIRSAIEAQGYRYPMRRVIVNLAPADIKKKGSVFDLPVALALLLATDQLGSQVNLSKFCILGELALDGKVRSFQGLFSMVISAYRQGWRQFILPEEGVRSCSFLKGIELYPVRSLQEACDAIENNSEPFIMDNNEKKHALQSVREGDWSDILGHDLPKRAMEIAVSGGHNILLIGPPGSGKSLLASRLKTILPELGPDEKIEVMAIQSVVGAKKVQGLSQVRRPYRAPHHSISVVGLIGGGNPPVPGEITLAHQGVLFLDELTEFSRSTLENLRQPLEEKEVRIVRSGYAVKFPSQFILVAAMNPCPCGYLTDKKRSCSCSVPQIQRYLSKVSGPLLDRIDLHVEVHSVSAKILQKRENCLQEKSDQVRERVRDSWQKQRNRNSKGLLNAHIETQDIRDLFVTKEAFSVLEDAADQQGMSARSHHKILKIARTIADLEKKQNVLEDHVLEAMSYRSLDRTIWG